ncbi:MAG: DUF3108 domain-containing protein [Candidatus Omnitrophica bacterium]|nr:DUF3108 domain-containing protein [Candidatus Omnitrophota bacterium]
MKKNVVLSVLCLLILSFAYVFGVKSGTCLLANPVNKFVYTISPLGVADFSDLGIVKLCGQDVRLHTLKTRIFGFEDTEIIYSDLKTFLPIRIERDVARWLGKERIVEEYDQENFTLTTKKFRGCRQIQESVIENDGPINNAILALYDLRTFPELEIGQSFKANLPTEFEIKLESIDQLKISKDIFETYHFISVPDKFETWISKDKRRMPLKIKLRIGVGYTLVLKEYFEDSD